MPVLAETEAGGSAFTTTKWTVVFSALDGDALAARERLARLYWFPLYAFVRRKGHGPDEAADAVQTFLARLLAEGRLAGVTREGGRFRDFLRTSLANQLVSAHRQAASSLRQPAGGFLSLDGLDPEACLAEEPADRRTPEQAYDRLCARALLDATLAQLAQEHDRAGRGPLFTHLAACLDGDPDHATHAAAAVRLGLSEGTVRNAVKPFRERFQVVFRQHIAATLDDPGQVDEEIRHLLAALWA